MANVNANINVNIQTQQAAAQLRKLSADISRFNQQTFAANSAAAQQQRALNQALIDGVRTSGQFRTSIVPITSAVDRFATSIEKGQLSLGQYTRYAASQLPGMRRVFTREFDMIQRVATSRVKTLNTQFVALGDSVNGAQKALAMTPVALDQYSSRAAIALQRTQIFNRLLRDGSTQLLNWGKNTQWAGRQLMVGFTIPLGILGAQAAKVFKELEAEAVNFRKVYGDMFTTDVEVEKNLQAVKELATEMTKYGISIQQSMELANVAAQSGARGADLISQTTEATRLAVLGQMEQQEAIKTTITLQNAFQLSNEELTESINFLNVVENQSVLSLQNVTEAIPRVAPVIKSLGGDVKDLSVMLVAMREGGVSAAEGANALKTSLARLVSPTAGAVKMAEKFGINLQNIVVENKGDILGAVMELADAMKVLDDLSQQQLMSEIFGKRQYARVGALFNNITNEASQAQRVLELTNMSTRDLAATAERELGAVEESVTAKFTGAMERAKLALAPVGEEFLKALTPVVDFIGKILSKFSELPEGLKTAIVAATGIIGGLAPIILMVTGLVANGIANIGKFILFLRKQIATIRGNGEAFKMYTSAELEAAAAATSLEGKTSSLTATMNLQKPAIETLITLYQRLAASARAAAAAMPATMGAGPMIGAARAASLPKGGLPTLPQARNAGGPIFMANGRAVPGSGNTDKVPAMLTPGEYVVNKEATQSNRGLLEAINSGNVASKNKGGGIPGVQYFAIGGAVLSRAAQISKIRQSNVLQRNIEDKSLRSIYNLGFNDIKADSPKSFLRGMFGRWEATPTRISPKENTTMLLKGKKPKYEQVSQEQYLADMIVSSKRFSNVDVFKPVAIGKTPGRGETRVFDGHTRIHAQTVKAIIEKNLGKDISSMSRRELIDAIRQIRQMSLNDQISDSAILKAISGEKVLTTLASKGQVERLFGHPLKQRPMESMYNREGRVLIPGIHDKEIDAIVGAASKANFYGVKKDKSSLMESMGFVSLGNGSQYRYEPSSVSGRSSYIKNQSRRITDRLIDEKSILPLRRNRGGIIPGMQYLRLGGITQYLSQTAGRSGVQNKYQARSIENRLGEWLGGNMKSVNFRELVKTGVARSTGQTELFRGVRMKSADEKYLGFPPEVQNALFMYGKTKDPSFLKPILGRTVAIEPRSFSQSRKVAKEFSGANEGVVSPVMFKLTNEKGIFGVNPYSKVGSTRQSKDQAREARSFRFSEKEVIPVGNPAIGQRPDAIVARISVDKKGDIILDSGGKFSKREISRASKELYQNKKIGITPKDILRQDLLEIEKLENRLRNITKKGIPQGDKSFLDEMSSMFNSIGLSKSYNPGTYSDKKLVQKIEQRKRALSDKISQTFNAAGGIARNEGGIIPAPQGLSLFSPEIMRTWANKKSRKLTSKLQKSQSEVFMANRGNIVPGSGNTDTVPAMLTPGEFVVNKKATQQNLPLIQAINNNDVSRLNQGGGAGPLPNVGDQRWVFAHGKDFTKIVGAQAQALRSQGPKAIRESTGTLRGYSNLGFMLPETANQGKMSPSQMSQLFRSADPKISQRIMLPLYQSIARNLGKNVSDVMKDPKITKQVNDYSKRLGTEIGKITGKAVNNDAFYKAVSATSTKGLTEVTKGLRSMSKITTVGTAARGGRGERVALSRTLQKSVFGTVGAQRSYYGDAAIKAARSPMPMPQPSQRTARAPITYSQATSTQAMARQIMREAPGTNARQALQIARLQQMAGAGGGGGGRTPTFLGMPGMPEQPPRQSMYARANAAVGKFGMGAGMGLSMAGMLPMMNQDEQGKFMGMDASTAMMGMMGGGMLLSLAPMMGAAALPILAVGTIAAGLGIGLKIWRNNVDEAAKKTADLGANMGGTANALNTMATLFGEQTPTQRRTQMQLGFTAEEQEQSFGEFQNYLGSEQGQAFIKDLEELTSADRFVKLSSYLSNAIAGGILDEEKAKLFAKTVSSSLNDAVLGSSVIKAIEDQKMGAEGLLELAEKRLAVVEKSGAVQRIGSEEVVASTDAASVIGSSVQIIQDFSNAAALAKEEYIAGNTSFIEYRKTVNRAREAQERYTSAMEGAFIKTNDFGATMQGWKDQLTLAGKDEEIIGTFQRAATRTEDPSSGIVGNLAGYLTGPGNIARITKTAKQITGGQATIGNVANAFFTGAYTEINEELLAAMSSASLTGKYSDADLVAIAERIVEQPQGRIAQVFEEYGRGERGIGRALFEQKMQESDIPGLTGEDEQRYIDLAFQFDERSGDLVDYETFINNIPEELRTKILIDFEGLTGEARSRMVADQAFFANMFGMDTATDILTQSAEYRGGFGLSRELGVKGQQQRQRFGISVPQESLLEDPYIGPLTLSPSGSPITDPVQSRRLLQSFDNQGPAATVQRELEQAQNEEEVRRAAERVYQSLGESGQEAISYALNIELITEPDPRKLSEILNTISSAVEYIDMNIPKDIQIALGVDTTDPQQMDDLNKYKQDLAGLASVVELMTEEEQQITSRIAVSVVDGENKPLTAEELIAQVAMIQQAVKNLESENLSVEKQATLTIIQSYEDVDGQRITPEKSKEFLNKWVEDFGQEKISLLNEVEIGILTSLDVEIEGQQEALNNLREARKLALIAGADNKVAEIDKQISSINAMISGKQAAKKLTIDRAGSSQPSGGTSGGGGGGATSPVESFVKGITDQYKMWVDASAKVGDINNAKKSFVDQVLKGNSIFDKLSSVKGISASKLEQILGMGPEGAQEFLDKYVTKKGLNKKGKNILQAATLAGIGQTMGVATISTETSETQTDAANILRNRGAGSQVIQSIAGDPQKAEQLVALQKEYKKAVKGGNEKEIDKGRKALNRFIKKQVESLQAEKDREEAFKSSAQKLIESNNETIEANNEAMEEGDYYFEQQTKKIQRSYRDRINAAEDQVEAIQDQIDSVNDEIEALERLNRQDEIRIRGLERQKEMLSRQIEEIDRANELDQRRIDTLSREDEIRNRVADALGYELEQLSKTEEEIRETYDKRMEALDKVIQANDYIINQQKQQVNLSRAISEGDIYAATQAAQEMRAESGRFALQQVRGGLETGMENQLGNLRTASGLTREEAEERIEQIKDQSYQTSLQIRDIEDAIYNRNLEMIPLKDQILNYDMQIRDIQDVIYGRETEILNIQVSRLDPLQQSLERQQDVLDNLNDQLSAEIESIKYLGMNADQWADSKDLIMDQNRSLEKQNQVLQEEDERLAGISKKWNRITRQIVQANKAAQKRRTDLKAIAAAEIEQIKSDTDLTDDEIDQAVRDRINKRRDDLAAVEANRQEKVNELLDSGQNLGKFAGGIIKYATGGIINPRKFTSNEPAPVQKRAKGGSVFGTGTRDSVPAMLTPGEFVIRKAMVDKYGSPFFEAINQGAFSVPRYSLPEQQNSAVIATSNNVTSVSAPVYNTYDMKFSINGSNQNPDEIANQVMFKMRQLQNQNIRGNRGY